MREMRADASAVALLHLASRLLRITSRAMDARTLTATNAPGRERSELIRGFISLAPLDTAARVVRQSSRLSRAARRYSLKGIT